MTTCSSTRSLLIHRSALAACLLLLFSCEKAEERYDVGFDDGVAVGYNTACGGRANLIEGDWSNAEYSRGHNEGLKVGAAECRKNRSDDE